MAKAFSYAWAHNNKRQKKKIAAWFSRYEPLLPDRRRRIDERRTEQELREAPRSA